MKTKTDPVRVAIVDELGALDTELGPQLAILKPKMKRFDELRKMVASWYDEEAPEADFQASGDKFTAVIEARGWERRITDMRKLAKILTHALFFEHCSFALGKFDKLVDVEKHKDLVVKEQTGTRTVTVIRKAA
jgi:hypothetical protein